MSLNPTDPTVADPHQVARLVVAGTALVVLLFAMAMVVRADDGPARDRVETAAGEDQVPSRSPNQRPGRPATRTAPTRPDLAPPPGATVTATSTRPTAPGRPHQPTSPASAPTPPAMAPSGSNAPWITDIALQMAPTGKTPTASLPTSPTPTQPTQASSTTTTTTTTTSQGSTPDPSGPITPTPEPPGPGTPTVDIPTPEPTEPTEPTEQELCANLDLVAVGDPAVGDIEAEAARTRFRDAIPQIPRTDDLVCGKPVARHLDDLLIQRLQVAGQNYGFLVGGTGPTQPVLWLSEVEWTSFTWRNPGSTNHNFTGVPIGRVTIGGHEMIRTSRGAVVMVRADSWGYTVIGGAWDVWMASGGPTGPMGLPEAKATGSYLVGVYQDFTNGVLELPGVFSDLEAEVMPASRYKWVLLTDEDLAKPAPAPHSIQDVNGVSYYVDRDGARHWIDKDWDCAIRLGAPHIEGWRGWQVAKAPLGSVFTCPSNPPA